MNFSIITNKTLPCTFCGKRVKINKGATFNERSERVFELKCPHCGAIFEYAGGFVDNVLIGKEKI